MTYILNMIHICPNIIVVGRCSLLMTKQTSPYQVDRYMSHTKQTNHTKGRIGIPTDPMCPCVISTHIPMWKYLALVHHTPRPYYAIFIFSMWEDVLKISVTLTPPPPYKENPCILGIQVYSASLYKQQVFSFPSYAEFSQLSHYRVLGDFSFTDLTFGWSLAGTRPVLSVWFLVYCSLGTHWSV